MFRAAAEAITQPRKFATSVNIFALLLIGDFNYVSKKIAEHNLVPNYSVPGIKKTPCETKQCVETAAALVKAVALWRETKAKQGIAPPSYLNTAYVLRAAGMESDMGGNLRRAGSQYEGIFQFSRRSGHLPHYMDPILAVLNVAKDKIPVLKDLKEVERQHLLKNDKIFNDPTVQAFLKLESVYAATRLLEKNDPAFRSLSDAQVHSMLYLMHNLPAAMYGVLDNIQCGWGVQHTLPKMRRYFQPNSGVYQAHGLATSAEVLARVHNFTNGYVLRYDSAKVTEMRPTRWGEWGLTAHLYGVLQNTWNCKPR